MKGSIGSLIVTVLCLAGLFTYAALAEEAPSPAPGQIQVVPASSDWKIIFNSGLATDSGAVVFLQHLPSSATAVLHIYPRQRDQEPLARLLDVGDSLKTEGFKVELEAIRADPVSLTFYGRSGRTKVRGKVTAGPIPGAPDKCFALIGTWPARLNKKMVEDFDWMARQIKAGE